MRKDEALVYRASIERASSLLPDSDAVRSPGMFPAWSASRGGRPVRYLMDERVRYGGKLYRCLSEHTAQEGWDPVSSPSLWTKVLIPNDSRLYPWEQPSSTNGYHKGDHVLHKEQEWVSTLEGNVWEPGVYAWEPV